MIISFIIWVLIGAATSYFAKQRNRDPALWFFIGMLLGLIGLVILFILPVVDTPKESEKIAGSDPVHKLPQFIEPPDFALKVWFFLDNERKQQGPISFSVVRTMWQQNKLHNESVVWCEGMHTWCKVNEIPNLIETLNLENP
jgi:GYF domain 2